MNKCLRITFNNKISDKFLKDIIQKNARKFDLEGLAHVLGAEAIKIVICGQKENVDAFLDLLIKESTLKKYDSYEIEPFLKDRDYRGVFRIIE